MMMTVGYDNKREKHFSSDSILPASPQIHVRPF